MRISRPLRAAALALTACLLVACSTGAGGKSGGGRLPPSGPRLGDDRKVSVTEMSAADRQQVAQAWRQFRSHSRLWPLSLKMIVERGGAGPYLLSENLFRHFFTASLYSKPAEIDRVARAVAVIGEPAASYFAKPLVTDLVPLGRAVVVEVPDPDNPDGRIKKTFHNFQIDDFTRRDAARVLAAIGAPAVETLASVVVQPRARPSGRRYAAFALGRIGTDRAVAVLSRVLRENSNWQERAAAAKALGAALPKNPAARAPLEAALEDPDPFVRKKADEALAGRTKLPF